MNIFFYNNIKIPNSINILTSNLASAPYDYYVCPTIFRGVNLEKNTENKFIQDITDKLEFFKDFPEKHVFLLDSDSNYYFDELISKGCKVFSNSPDKNTYPMPFFMQSLYGDIDIAACSRKHIEDSQYFISFQGCIKYPASHLRQNLINNIKQIENKYPIYIQTNERYFWSMTKPENQSIERLKYFNNLTNSKFVLCPRGAGTNSARFYETIWHGRIPILISDDTKLPLEKFIDWNYIIRIKENNLESIEQKVLEYLDCHNLQQASLYLQTISKLFTIENLPLLISRELKN